MWLRESHCLVQQRGKKKKRRRPCGRNLGGISFIGEVGAKKSLRREEKKTSGKDGGIVTEDGRRLPYSGSKKRRIACVGQRRGGEKKSADCLRPVKTKEKAEGEKTKWSPVYMRTAYHVPRKRGKGKSRRLEKSRRKCLGRGLAKKKGGRTHYGNRE